ncbi:MAG TPA: CBS domain-containing protein [Methylomirabilota bacterium]|jgi:CBS domain-containing protein|nr:CBS domain-containing protein [Methylomirabilota bacterium]
MLVADVMQSKLVTVTPRTTLPEAIRLVGQRGIRHLPVVDGDRLVGISPTAISSGRWPRPPRASRPRS